METDKKSIHMNYRKGSVQQIVTIDDDFNVPDVKPDIVKKIKETGRIVMEKVRPMEERIAVAGQLKYKLLYATEKSCACMEDGIDFDESVPMEGITPQDIVKCTCDLEDITVNVINSRKISVKAVIVINLTAEAVFDSDAVCGIDVENLQSIDKNINVMQLAAAKKDIFRIRESMNLPSDRPNVGEIIWYELEPQSMDVRACDGELVIKGDLYVFCIYSAEDNDESVNYYDDVIAFSGKVDVAGCTEEMLTDITAAASEQSLIARPDANGELRIIDVEVIMDLDIKGYAEEEYKVLSDAYSPSYELVLHREEMPYQSFLLKNSVKCRTEDRFKLPQGGILQIINSSGRTNIEELTVTGDGVLAEGAVTVDVIYIKPDDNDKIGYARYELPFSEHCDIKGINENCICQGKTGPLQVSTLLTGGGEIDIKCSAVIELIVIEKHSEGLIKDVEVNEPDYEKIKSLPGITGYITKEGDRLWDIAKKYCTTVKDITETNNLPSEQLSPGTKLIVIKTC